MHVIQLPHFKSSSLPPSLARFTALVEACSSICWIWFDFKPHKMPLRKIPPSETCHDTIASSLAFPFAPHTSRYTFEWLRNVPLMVLLLFQFSKCISRKKENMKMFYISSPSPRVNKGGKLLLQQRGEISSLSEAVSLPSRLQHKIASFTERNVLLKEKLFLRDIFFMNFWCIHKMKSFPICKALGEFQTSKLSLSRRWTLLVRARSLIFQARVG